MKNTIHLRKGNPLLPVEEMNAQIEKVEALVNEVGVMPFLIVIANAFDKAGFAELGQMQDTIFAMAAMFLPADDEVETKLDNASGLN